jgi:hypothetical protein
MIEFTPASQGLRTSVEGETSLLAGASSFLTALGGLLLTVAGMAADGTSATIAGIALGITGSPLVFLFSRTRRGRAPTSRVRAPRLRSG